MTGFYEYVSSAHLLPALLYPRSTLVFQAIPSWLKRKPCRTLAVDVACVIIRGQTLSTEEPEGLEEEEQQHPHRHSPHA